MTARRREARPAMLAKIHIARKDLGLDDDTYRDVLRRVAGKDSAGAMSTAELERTLGEFRRLGWVPTNRLRQGRTPVGRLLRVLWREAAREPSEAALRAMIRRVLGLPETVTIDPDMLTRADATKVVEAVKAMRRRAAEGAAASGGAR